MNTHQQLLSNVASWLYLFEKYILNKQTVQTNATLQPKDSKSYVFSIVLKPGLTWECTVGHGFTQNIELEGKLYIQYYLQKKQKCIHPLTHLLFLLL